MSQLKFYNRSTGQWQTAALGTTGYTGSAGSLGYTGSTGAGYTGSAGTTGYTGSTGSLGYTGSTGAGYTGSVGALGYTGSIGYTGSTGAGYTGSAGSLGYTGSTGAGYTGSSGTTGYTGSTGSLGYTGSTGAGYTGSSGTTGYTGSAGFSPTLATASINDLGDVDTATKTPTVGQSLIWNGANWVPSSVNSQTILNDISTQFTGAKAHFALKIDQTPVNSIIDSKDLEVVIGGLRLTPYVITYTWPWISTVDSFNGFRVRTFDSANYITIYNAPSRGTNSFIVLKPPSTTTQKRRYPFSAATIALGD
jgi:hypothetical protein